MLKRLVKNLIYPVTRIKPRLLILGAQKSGTTTLYEHLTAHPRIVPNRSWKEVRFFEIPERYREGFGSYLGCFPSRIEARGRMTLDASPSYLFFPDIPHRIRKALGNDVLMIAILRNPAERAYSAWKMYHSYTSNEGVHEVNRRIADRRTFTEAVMQELNGCIPGQMYPYWYVSRGLYAEQIENYYRVFDKRNLLFLEFERLRNDFSNLLDEVTNFLGLAHFSADQKSRLQSESHNTGLSRTKSAEDEQTIQLLADFYRPHNARLEKLLGWKLDW